MEWNSHKMAHMFLSRANAYHPEEEESALQRSTQQAMQDVLYECYMNSFSKEVLVTFLDRACAGEVKEIPKDMEEEPYVTAYVKQAKTVLSELNGNP